MIKLLELSLCVQTKLVASKPLADPCLSPQPPRIRIIYNTGGLGGIGGLGAGGFGGLNTGLNASQQNLLRYYSQLNNGRPLTQTEIVQILSSASTTSHSTSNGIVGKWQKNNWILVRAICTSSILYRTKEGIVGGVRVGPSTGGTTGTSTSTHTTTSSSSSSSNGVVNNGFNPDIFNNIPGSTGSSVTHTSHSSTSTSNLINWRIFAWKRVILVEQAKQSFWYVHNVFLNVFIFINKSYIHKYLSHRKSHCT